MSYIVIFNSTSKDSEILTDNLGFVVHFANVEAAADSADNWLDNDQYRSFQIYEEVGN